jgi:hypothetical protein
MKKEKIVFYRSPLGMPFAIKGNKIAYWFARDYSKNKEFFKVVSVKEFEKKHFPISKLQIITHGMPEKYKKGLVATLTEDYEAEQERLNAE